MNILELNTCLFSGLIKNNGTFLTLPVLSDILRIRNFICDSINGCVCNSSVFPRGIAVVDSVLVAHSNGVHAETSAH